MPGTRYTLEVPPTLPPELGRLHELAGNLIYGWDRRIRGVFYFMDAVLWTSCQHNPKVFLRRISQARVDALARDMQFMQRYADAVNAFDSYMARRPETPAALDQGPVAYFCMEYGLYESLKLYSGGLGVLAGDYCKAASDLGIPCVAVGLMYHLGYFTQTINADGEQEVHYQSMDIDDLPVRPAFLADGRQAEVEVEVSNRRVAIKVWEVAVGHVHLLLLDSDAQQNTTQDRAITYQLYGGDEGTRIAQEIVLGIGGVRALRALGIAPSVWHINEGHAAFQILERCREEVAHGLDYDAAMEVTAAATLFTTHTPVSAGHDVFNREMMLLQFERFAQDLRIPFERLYALGAHPPGDESFNMTALALRGSRRHNGVSRVHRQVAAAMESYIWPQIPADESPIDYVNNGVHASTFLARPWVALLDERFPEWRRHLSDLHYWPRILEEISDEHFWHLRQTLKREMLADICGLLMTQYQRNHAGRIRCEQMSRALDAVERDVLVIGFARRFATYKRALLLFQDLPRLMTLLQQAGKPVIILFSGKAHPQDRPAQQIIKELNRYTRHPDLSGRIFFLEGHDIALERKLVTGVDLWLNTPAYPQEASGTSGQKAAINGVINLSVLDGWWAEGYDGSNGWAIHAHDPSLDDDHRNRIEAEELLDILERDVLPLYYQREGSGLPREWVRMSKRSMASILPRYNSERMVGDYLRRFYLPAVLQHAGLTAGDAAGARELAQWKTRILSHWPHVRLRWRAPPPAQLQTGQQLTLSVAVGLNGLQPGDVRVECQLQGAADPAPRALPFRQIGTEGEDCIYNLESTPETNGLMQLSVRMYPYHPLLAHPFELGCMLWL
ncbi:MAG TPA: alpha-glucan family phosphorylase [Gammaproteobacteria bacterium]|nr:alpha-glucan family phosphorylase [Gammaproteobacteria bacterium]